MSKHLTLSQDETRDLNILCDLANHPNNKQLQLADKSNDSPKRPPLRLQNLALPARVAGCRVILAVANGIHYKKALQAEGMTHLQFSALRHQDHDFALVFEAAKRVRDELTVANAQTGLDRLITEDGCDLNAKAVMFAAERLDPKRFGKAAEDAEGGRSGAKAVYNIVIQAVPQAKPCDNLATNADQAEVIDVIPNE